MEAAYQALLHQEEKNDSAATEQEELQAQVIAWLQTPDWETSQTYLQRHPQLLTDAAEQMIEALRRSQGGQQAQEMIDLHQTLLQKARLEGNDAAYERFLVHEPETPLSDQEVAIYHALQDPAIWNEAGVAAFYQYRSSGRVAKLNRAIVCWHEALNLTRVDSPDRPGYLSNLGIGLRDRYRHTGDPDDLEAAITFFRQAAQATPPDSPDRSMHLNYLGTGLCYRYRDTGALADLEAAITFFQQAVQATPPNSPGWSIHLNNLGAGLHHRYAHTGDLADLEAAISAWERSWSIPHPRFVAFPVTYQLGQQRRGAGVAVSLVTAYLSKRNSACLAHPVCPVGLWRSQKAANHACLPNWWAEVPCHCQRDSHKRSPHRNCNSWPT